MTFRALDLLKLERNDSYEAALAALREDTRDWWADVLARDPDELDEGEEPATADAEGLRRFLEDEVLPWFETRRKELANRPLIREQAFGEALDPDKLGSVFRGILSRARTAPEAWGAWLEPASSGWKSAARSISRTPRCGVSGRRG